MMSAVRRSACIALALFSIAGAPARADDRDTIEYRQHVMKTLGEQATLLGMIAGGKAPTTDLAAHARVLAMTATTAKAAFQPNVAGGSAKPEVWAQWPEFAKRLDTLVASTTEVAKAAESGDPKSVGAKLQALPCKGCHDTFRAKK